MKALGTSRFRKIAGSHATVSKCGLAALVKSVNGICCEDLLKSSFKNKTFITQDCCCCSFIVKCLCCSDLTPNQQEKVFSILEQNMKVRVLRVLAFMCYLCV